MKALPTVANLDEKQEKISNCLINRFPESLVFFDTNILIWIFRLNEDSFLEFKKLINSLVERDCLIIPNWVVHEYNNLLLRNLDDIFFPFKKRLKSLDRDLDYLNEVGLLTTDRNFSKKHGYANKREFIKELKHDIESLKKKVRQLKDKSNFKIEERREFINKLIMDCQSSLNINELLKLEPLFNFRINNNIPPGFKDKNKETNRYGDVIIWYEILENSKLKKRKNVLFISHDVKIDWVFLPKKIIVNDEEKYNTTNPKHFFIHPWLSEEFTNEVENGKIAISDISGIVDVLYSPDFNQIMFEDFKHLAKTVDIELNNSETNKVIEWLVVNGHKLHELRNTICYYESDPGDVDIDELKDWCVKNIIGNIEFKKVKWIDVFINLFL